MAVQIGHGVVGDWRLEDAAFLQAFRLPSAADKHETLKQRNPIAKEERIQFDEASHTYTFDAHAVPKSVTGVIHQYTNGFEPYAAVQAMKQRDWDTKQLNYLREDGCVKTDEEIVSTWERNGEVARSRGTLMHFHIEQLLNGCGLEHPHSPEVAQFLELRDTLQLQPFRTEICVYSEEMDVAGQVDCLCLGEGGLEVWDWKRAKEVKPDGYRSMRAPLHHLPDSSFWQYSLQLNLYRHVLENDGFAISRMALGVFHPLSDGPSCIEIPRMDAEIEMIVDCEKCAAGLHLSIDAAWLEHSTQSQ